MFSKIISLENLFKAYYKFRKGKRSKLAVAEFEIFLEENIYQIHKTLKNGTYKHKKYYSFKISDPKPRIIHSARVEDKIIHQAIFQIIEPIFEKAFIFDSYSSRKNKGHHKACKRLEHFVKKESDNYKINCYALKLDIKKFFNSMDHKILFNIIQQKISDKKALMLIEKIICSYNFQLGKGLPLGNVTSQLFANIYLNLLDHFIKEKLEQKYYIRYSDDFIIIKNNDDFEKIFNQIKMFCINNLKLSLKNVNLSIRKLNQGFDFLGFVILPHHRILRLKTKKRLLKNINKNNINSYLGLLKHCSSYKFIKKININGNSRKSKSKHLSR